MRVTRVETLEALDGLRGQWDLLAQSAPAGSVFTTWEWQRSWWRHYGNGQRLCVLAAYDADRLVGILPLYIQRVSPVPRVPVNLLRFLGAGGETAPDYLDPLLAPDAEETAAGTLVEAALELEGWDLLSLGDMDAQSVFARVLRDALARRGLPTRTGVSARISYVALPESWDAYLNTLGRDRRYTVRNTRRKLEREPGARFFVWDGTARLDDAVDRLVSLHHRRWQEKNEQHAFATPSYVAFHREVMHACATRDWLRLYCLERAGEIIAMYYCYRYRGGVFYFQGGFDPAYEKLRPGLCLMGYAIEQAIAEGNSVFDMLRGEYDYKKQWAKEIRETSYVMAYRRTAPAFVYWLRRSVLPAAKRFTSRALGRGAGRSA